MNKRIKILKAFFKNIKSQIAFIVLCVFLISVLMNLFLILLTDYRENFVRQHRALHAEHISFVGQNADFDLLERETSRILSKKSELTEIEINFDTNIISQLSGMLYHVLMCCNSMADNRLNLPVNVYGSGYAFKFPWRRLFHQIDTIVDDFEFSCLMVLNRAKLVAAPKAVIYAEMPEKMQDALIQRQRWAFGDTQCYRKYRHDFRKAIVTHGMSGLKQYMDLVMNPVVFLTAFGLVLWILDAILHGIRVRQVIYGAIALIITYLVFELMALFLLKKESLQIRPGVKAMLLFPFWVLLSGWEAIVSVLKHDIEWKPTKRNSSKKIEDMKGAE